MKYVIVGLLGALLSGCVSSRKYHKDMDGLRGALAQIRSKLNTCEFEAESYEELSRVLDNVRPATGPGCSTSEQ